ncbi:MAG: hypothetical protein RSC66_11370, partial [Comamonas sp.]
MGRRRALLGLGLAAFGALALWSQAPGGRFAAAALAGLWVIWVGASCLLASADPRSWRAWGLLAAGCVLLGLWWVSILPSNDRVWAADVARTLRAERAEIAVTGPGNATVNVPEQGGRRSRGVDEVLVVDRSG